MVPNSELTVEQRREVQVDSRRHRVFFGEPGAGCTQALLHRARRLLDAAASPDRLRVLLPGEGLTSFLRPELSLLGLPQECVTTLDAWRKDWCGEGLLDFALVDDAQGLDQEDYEFLRAAAVHVTVAVGRTPHASVGDRAAGVAAALGLAEPPEALLGMRRGTPHLGQVAAAFLGDPRDRAEFLRHVPSFGARETPLVYEAESVRDEDDRLAAVVQTR